MRLVGSLSGRSFLWLAADRAVRIVFSIFVGFWVARYLGPERFGLFNYALAAVALMGPLAELGLDAVARREFVRHPEQGPVLAGTILRLRLMGGLVALGLVAAWAFWPGLPADERRLFAILSLATLQPVGMVAESWLQSRLEARRLVVSQWGALLAGAIARVVAVLSGSPLEVFAGISVLEMGLMALLVIRSAKRRGMQFGGFDPVVARTLLAESWPLALSGLAVAGYMRVDTLMLRALVGPKEVGTYAAATRLTEIWYFVPVALTTSLLPWLTRVWINTKDRHESFQVSFDLHVGLAYLIAVPTALAAPWIVPFLYGTRYEAAGPVVALHAWTLPFVFLGVARGQYLLNAGLTRFYLFATGAGLVVNIGMNVILIPHHGAIGAAIATIVGQATAAWFSTFSLPRLTDCARMQTLALILPLRVLLGRPPRLGILFSDRQI